MALAAERVLVYNDMYVIPNLDKHETGGVRISFTGLKVISKPLGH